MVQCGFTRITTRNHAPINATGGFQQLKTRTAGPFSISCFCVERAVLLLESQQIVLHELFF